MFAKEAQYYRFIEALLYWQGELQISQFEHYFNLSRPSAQKHLAQCIDALALDVQYCEISKAHRLESSFTPRLISTAFDEYTSRISNTSLSELPSSACGQALFKQPLPKRQLNPEILRPILTACRRQTPIDIEYLSLKESERPDRIIHPHTLVNSGLRYHVRAYCEAAKGYRDFSLSRILAASHGEKRALKYIQSEDELWQKKVTLTLIPDPRLDAHSQRVIAHDFAMEDGKKHLTTNAALLNYLINILRLDCLHPNPEAQQIVMEPKCYRVLRAEKLLWN